MLVWRHSTAKHFRFRWWIRVKTGFAGFTDPDSDSGTEWTVSLNPTRIQIRIRQIEYDISQTSTKYAEELNGVSCVQIKTA